MLSGFTNKSVMEYLQYKAKKSSFYAGRYEFYENKHNQMSQLGEFQLFDFSLLLNFSNSTKSQKCFPTKGSDGRKLSTLRNLAMHGKDIVSQDRDSSIYSIESLIDFFNDLTLLQTYSNELIYQIRNHPEYVETLEIDNRKKLEIIHTHRPEALQYFLGGRV